MTTRFQFPVWLDEQGKSIACKEKIKVMEENMSEFMQNAQDIFEDALLMGCEESQVKDFMQQLLNSLHNPYKE